MGCFASPAHEGGAVNSLLFPAFALSNVLKQ